MANEIIEIEGRIIKPIGPMKVNGFHHGHLLITNPDYTLNSETEKKYLNVFFKKWAGLKPLLTRGRVIMFTGYYNVWEFEDLGKVFICQSVREITFDDIKPVKTNEIFEEYVF